MQNAERKYKIQNTECTSNSWFLAKNSNYKIRIRRIQDEWRMIRKYNTVNRVFDKRYRIQIPIKNRHIVLNVPKKNFEKSLPRSWRSFGFLFLSFKILKRGIQVLRYPWIRPLLSESRTILPSPGLWFNTVELFELDPETNKPSLWFELKWDSSRLTRMDSVLIKDIK